MAAGSVMQSEALLLDTYPNARYAHSLRLINTSYTGDAVSVRRSSDNADRAIGFDGGVLDLSGLSSFCGSSDGFVARWYDQSGNDRHLDQTTAARQPKIYDGSSAAVISDPSNNKPAMRVEKADAGTSEHKYWTLPSGSRRNGDRMFTAVANKHDTSTDFKILDTYMTVNVNEAIRMYGGSNWIQSSNYVISVDDAFLVTVDFRGTDSTLRVNATELCSGNSGTTFTYVAEIGARNGGNEGSKDGYFQEVIDWDSWDNDNTQGMELAINTFYSIY